MIENIIKTCQRLKSTDLVFTYDCGGDEFGSLDIDNPDNVDLTDCDISTIEGDIYDSLEFYVNSDGHYIGEYGKIYVELETIDGRGVSIKELMSIDLNNDEVVDLLEEKYNYCIHKEATYQYNKYEDIEIEYSIEDETTEKQIIDFYNQYINTVHLDYDSLLEIEYKQDFVITKELSNLINQFEDIVLDILNKLDQKVNKFIEEQCINPDNINFDDYSPELSLNKHNEFILQYSFNYILETNE